jgi:hypothetical protein
LTGPGVLTDVIPQTPAGQIAISTGNLIRLRDGQQGRILYETEAGILAVNGWLLLGANLEFESGLFLDIVAVAPNMVGWTIGAFIQDRSPDPMAVQMQRVADELARLHLVNAALADFVKRLELGDPTR